MARRILPEFVRKNGKVVHSSAISDDEWTKIKRLLEAGVPKQALATRFNVTYGAIWNRLRSEKKAQRHA